MKFSIILCHYKTGKMTAYTISQILKYKGHHEIEILVCDNNSDDGSIEYLKPFINDVVIHCYPKDKLQSHGIGYDVLFEMAHNEWVIALESDSFPIKEGWLNYYARLINQGYDGAVSVLKLSGGEYGHPAGGLYRRSLWVEAWTYCVGIEYNYFPNMGMKDTFASHIMVHKSIANEFLTQPEDYIELADGYKPYTSKNAEQKCIHYMPVVGPMHNGMGRLQESLKTYGMRNTESEVPNIILDNRAKIIYRVGYEPGQHHYYWLLAKGYNIFSIPTETKWLEGKENQQQEYTLTENGVRHLWAISAYHDYTPESEKDTALYKQSIPDQLYNSLPEHQKISL
jgi:glycosyltransferase involved in cell wall biosynthesis